MRPKIPRQDINNPINEKYFRLSAS